MVAISITSIILGIIFYYVYDFCIKDKLNSKNFKKSNTTVFVLAAIAFIVRIVLALTYRGHNTDMGCFEGWSSIIFNVGIPNFYESPGFHDYPPGYMYILYLIGAIRSLINPSQNMTWLIVKLPAIICDITTAFLIYKISIEQNVSNKVSSVIAAIYLLNPAVILNSSIWGQVDSVYTFFVVIFLYLLTKKELIKSYFVFAICIFIKPQAFMFLPLIAFAIVENIFIPKFDKKAFIKNLLCGLCAIAMIFILAAPFGLSNVINQYKATLSSYPYVTVNAFNIWGALGQNWTPISSFMSIFGYVLLAIIVIYSAYVFFKTQSTSKYFFVAAILSFGTFMLSTKMHDRYAFPSMALLLAAFAINKNAKNYILYIFITLSQLINTSWVLFVYEQDINKHFNSPVVNIVSIINIAIMLFFIHYTNKSYITNVPHMIVNKPINNKITQKENKRNIYIKNTVKYEKLKKFDYIFIVSVMVIYSMIAFWRLGDLKAPQTEVTLMPNSPITIEVSEGTDISKLMIYLGSYNIDENRSIIIDYLDASHVSHGSENITKGSVFFWNDFVTPDSIAGHDIRYITISSVSPITIKEIGVIDTNQKLVVPMNSQESSIAAIFDEQNFVPDRQTFMNSTYFDEIYHARTAYEFIHSLDVYEWTHPPLGKLIIAIGVKLFGMVPFGWRFMGTLFGVLMIPVIYIFAKRLFNKSIFAAITCIIFTFDFMHFAQTRIATIDVYVTFFIMLMYLFMYRYFTMSFYDTPLKKTLVPLGLCGLSMGLGIATKWTGIYAGVGLAILFFITIYKRYSEYAYAKANPHGETNGISHKHIIDSFETNTVRTIEFCLIFFIVIPAIIYGLSYIPFLKAPSSNGFLTILKNQGDMFTYHSKTVVDSVHPFSSRWYEWILMNRPIFYYSGTISETVKEGISAFGNPAVWWVGIPAFVYLLYITFKSRDTKAFFLVLAYLAQLVSWIPVTRTTYIYHYFPSVPFVALMIGYCIYFIYKNNSGKQKAIIACALGYSAIVVGLFVLFYPVLSGLPCNVEFAENFLKWFDSWVLL